jgi:glycosyltransferase involved in cell wall biosynthesis
MSKPLISVVIPCYNAARYIGATIQSALAQEGVTFEIIAIDDGSQDDTAALIHSRFPMVRLRRTVNQGPSAARNLGTFLSHGEFIQYLDADDLLAQGKLLRQWKALEESGADVAYGDWTKFQASEVIAHVTRQLGRDTELDAFTDFWCPPAAYLFRRSIIDGIGGWDRSYPVIQDAKLVLDCAVHGARFVYCPGLAAEYRVHTSGSVSTGNREAFLADCLRIATEMRQLWGPVSELPPPRRQALIQAFHHVAAASVGLYADLFEAAASAVEPLLDRYPVEWAAWQRQAIRLLGYRRYVKAHRAVSRRLKAA